MTSARRRQSATTQVPADTALVVFAKAPTPGGVKTRLCPPLTHDEAATLHGSFVLDTLERIKAAAAELAPSFDRYLACSPSSSLAFFKIMEERQGIRLLDQEGDDLGERMSHTANSLFARGYTRVVIVGTDTPTLPIDRYTQAFTLLDQHDVVLGPSIDGGYHLIGLRQPAPGLFADIPWSTEHVLALTREKADTLGLRHTLLEPWRDIDTIEDLRALIDDGVADAGKPRSERDFSQRTAGVLHVLAQRLQTRA